MQPDVLTDVLTWIQGRFFGKYRGTVQPGSDDAERGRLPVRVPAVLGDTVVWAMPCVPYAGDGVGFASLPDEGAAVWIEFEGGDPSFPIWTGCFWGTGQMPARARSSPDQVKLWRTTSLCIELDEENQKVTVTSTGGGTLEISSVVASTVGSEGSVSASHEVASGGVTSSVGATATIDLSSAGLSVNDGALEVS